MELSLDSFYAHPQMADGHFNVCKECVKTRVTDYRTANADAIRDYDRRRGRTDKRRTVNREHSANCRRERADAISRTNKEWRGRNREKMRAHNAVQRAISSGKMARGTCFCGAPGEAHHPDYSKPLEVIWLCRLHHGEVHWKDKIP